MGLLVCPGLQPSRFPTFHTNPRRERSWGRPQGSGPISSRSGGVCQGGSILNQVSLAGLCSELGP